MFHDVAGGQLAGGEDLPAKVVDGLLGRFLDQSIGKLVVEFSQHGIVENPVDGREVSQQLLFFVHERIRETRGMEDSEQFI